MSTKKTLPLCDEELEEFEATRDLYSELMQAAKDIQAGLCKVVYSPVATARKNTGMSPEEFAQLLGISVSTLEEWEQGRQPPSGPARTLIAIALDNPQAILAALPRTSIVE